MSEFISTSSGGAYDVDDPREAYTYIIRENGGSMGQVGLHALNTMWKELTRLRAMLPQKVEGLPTEPGWYWCRGKYSRIQIKEVTSINSELYLWDGSKWVDVESFKGLTWYGPLTPPDHIGEANGMMEVE